MSATTATMTLRDRFDDAMRFVEESGFPADSVTIDITDFSHSVQVHPRGYREDQFVQKIVEMRGAPWERSEDESSGLLWRTWGPYSNSNILRVVIATKVRP